MPRRAQIDLDIENSKLIERLREKPRTKKYIAEYLGCTERHVISRLHMLEDLGFKVSRSLGRPPVFSVHD